jgi:DNA-binding MarR family transcriptional regulator
MPDRHELAYLFDRFMRRMEAGVHTRALKFDEERVGPFGGMVLMAVADAEPVSIHALTLQLARDKAQMTRTIQRLEAKGFVEREASADDARISILHLSEKGEALVVTIKANVAEVLDDLLSPLSASERAAFQDMLKRV